MPIGLVGRLEHLALAGGGHHQVILHVQARRRQCLELHAQCRVAGRQAGGIDQHHALARQRRQGLDQRLAGIDQGHRYVEDPTEGLDLLLGADPVAVHAHQRQALGAVLEDVARGHLRQGGGLAGACRADQGQYAARVERVLLGGLHGTRQVRQQHAPGLARIAHRGDPLQQRLAQLRRQAHALQAPPEIGLLRTLVLQLAPGDGTQLYLDQLAQAVQFETHCLEGLAARLGLGLRRRHGLGQGRTRRLLLGEQLTVLALGFRRTRRQLGARLCDPRLGLAQLHFQRRVGLARRRRGLVIQRRGQLNAAGDPAVAENRGVRTQFVADQFHGLAHIGGEEAFDLHCPNPSVQ